MKLPLVFCLSVGVCLLSVALPVQADIQYDANAHTWSLRSGSVEYRLGEKNGVVALLYFGPAGGEPWAAPKPRLRPYVRFETDGQVEGELLQPEELQFVSQKIDQPTPDCSQLVLSFKHRILPLEIDVRYITYGDTGVLTRQVTLVNNGDQVLHMESVPSVAWLLPPGDHTLTYLHGGHGEERQVAVEKIAVGQRAFVNRNGRSTNGYSPWFCVSDDKQGLSYGAQLIYSGNWQMSFEPYTERRRIPLPQQDLWTSLGIRFDFGGPALLQPGASFAAPAAAFTVAKGDVDDMANQLHRYQVRYVIPKFPDETPLITQLNTWSEFVRNPTAEKIKKYADLAAELGMESVAIDAGWVIKYDGKTPIFGDWKPDPANFPDGVTPVVDYVHSKGLKWGMWLEPETVSKNSAIAKEHPDWILRYNGVPMEGTLGRVYLDFSKPEVRDWVRSIVDGMMRDYKIDWLKIDYNADVGERFDPPGSGRSGLVLYHHLQNLYAWIDAIRAAYPNLIIENCASGGLRMDLAMASRTNFTWISDVTYPKSCMQLAYGATMEFAPQASYHWMSGDDVKSKVNPANPPGWWDFMFQAAMNGVFGIASNCTEWTPEIKEAARKNVILYKRIRGVIAGADVYHLTPPPEAGENPTGWMALQYVSPDGKKSVVMAYRLGGGAAQQNFHLRGLNPAWRYSVSEGGQDRGAFSGADLNAQGLPVKLDDEWRSAVLELATQN